MLYEIAAEHPGLFRKAGSATIVDLEMLDDVLSELPPALRRSTQRGRENGVI